LEKTQGETKQPSPRIVLLFVSLPVDKVQNFSRFGLTKDLVDYVFLGLPLLRPFARCPPFPRPPPHPSLVTPCLYVTILPCSFLRLLPQRDSGFRRVLVDHGRDSRAAPCVLDSNAMAPPGLQGCHGSPTSVCCCQASSQSPSSYFLLTTARREVGNASNPPPQPRHFLLGFERG
jgi:hypothetical protein